MRAMSMNDRDKLLLEIYNMTLSCTNMNFYNNDNNSLPR